MATLAAATVLISPAGPARADSATAKPRPPSEQRCAVGLADVQLSDRTGEAPTGTDIVDGVGWSTGPRQGGAGCYWIRVRGYFTRNQAQVVQVLVDVRSGRAGSASSRDRGPDAYAFGYSDKDRNQRRGAYFVKRTDDHGYQFRRCPVRTDFRPVGADTVGELAIGLPKQCLGGPRRIRVEMQVWDVRGFEKNHQFDTERSIGDAAPERGGRTVWSAAF